LISVVALLYPSFAAFNLPHISAWFFLCCKCWKLLSTPVRACVAFKCWKLHQLWLKAGLV
jgi:hypothetical protein